MAPRAALVTGGARGIGRAIASDLAADHDVIVSHHATPPDALLADHPGIRTIGADLADPAAAAGVIAATVEAFGRIDVLVCNAGAIDLTPIDTDDFGAHARVMAVNVLTPMALLAAALPHMAPGSAVVNISSVNARLPGRGAAAYSASKAALDTDAARRGEGARAARHPCERCRPRCHRTDRSPPFARSDRGVRRRDGAGPARRPGRHRRRRLLPRL